MPYLIDKNGILSAMRERPETIRRLTVEKGYERYADDIVREAKKQGISFKTLPPDLFQKKFPAEGSHVCLETEEFAYTDQDLFLNEVTGSGNPLLAAFDGIYDPQNLGNIVRSAACFEVGALIMPKERSCGVTETVVRIAKGGIDHTRIVRVTNLARYLDQIKKVGVFCYGLDEGAGRSLWDVDLTGPVCLVFGRESGLRRLTREKCDEVLKIPTSPDFASLNVATSFAVALYEAKRQRLAPRTGKG